MSSWVIPLAREILVFTNRYCICASNTPGVTDTGRMGSIFVSSKFFVQDTIPTHAIAINKTILLRIFFLFAGFII
jgi:hypothetical protein